MKVLLFIFIIPAICVAQVHTDLEAINNTRGSVFDVRNSNVKAYSGIDGTPYYYEEFLPISIEGYKNALPLVRYNAFEDEMEFKTEKGLSYVNKGEQMRIKFPSLNKTYILLNYIDYGLTSQTGFLVEVHNGVYSLLKSERSHIVEYNNNTTNTYLKAKNPYFEKVKPNYYIFDGTTVYPVPKNNKELDLWIERYKPRSKPELLNFIKSQKLNFGKEKDLILFTEYLNNSK